MLNKAAQNLRAIEGNRFFHSPVAVIFGDERDFFFVNIQDALVGNGPSADGCIAPGILLRILHPPAKARNVLPIWFCKPVGFFH